MMYGEVWDGWVDGDGEKEWVFRDEGEGDVYGDVGGGGGGLNIWGV